MKYLYLFLFSSSLAFGQFIGLEAQVIVPVGPLAKSYAPGIGSNLFFTGMTKRKDIVKINIVSHRFLPRLKNDKEVENINTVPLPLGLSYHFYIKNSWYIFTDAQFIAYDFENDDGLFGFGVSKWNIDDNLAISASYHISPFTRNAYISVGLSFYLSDLD